MIKTIRTYWGGGPLSYLRYLTYVALRKYNPDFEIIAYYPAHKYTEKNTWVSHAHTIKYTGEDWFPKLKTLGVKCDSVDFKGYGFENDVPEAFKSDFLQWKLLYKFGGYWCDTDILFFHGIPEIEVDFLVTADRHPTIYYIAYMYAEPGCPILERLVNGIAIDPLNYQSLGNSLLGRLYRKYTDLKRRHPGVDSFIINPAIVLPVKRISKIGQIYDKTPIDYSNSIGLHWFGGHPVSGIWENRLTDKNYRAFDNNLVEIMKVINGLAVMDEVNLV